MLLSESLVEKISKIETIGLPEDWKRIASLPIGGLRSVGFVKASKDLLLASLKGRGLVDCSSGKLILRETRPNILSTRFKTGLQHVIFKAERKNTKFIVVIDLCSHEIEGDFILNLNENNAVKENFALS